MIYRRSATAALVCVSLSLGVGGTPAWGQDATAPPAFEEGVAAFQEGRLGDALDAFERVDSDDLSPAEAQRLAEIRADIADMQGASMTPVEATPGTGSPDTGAADMGDPEMPSGVTLPAAEPTPREVLDSADAASRRGDVDEARNLYVQVLESDGNASDIETARVRLAYMDRIATDDPAAAAQSLIEGAVNDVRRADYEAAQAKYDQVRDMDVSLGWLEEQQLDRVGQVLVARRSTSESLADLSTADSPSATDPGVDATEGTTGVRSPLTSTDAVDVRDGEPASAAPPADVFAAAARDHANDRLASAQAARRSGQLDIARRYLEEAQSIDPDNAAVQAERQRVEEAANPDIPELPSPDSDIEQAASIAEVIRQRVIEQYESRLEQATNKLATGNYRGAINDVDAAKEIIQDNANRLGEVEYQNRMTRADSLSAAIIRSEREAVDRATETAIAESGDDATVTRVDSIRERQRQVQDLLVEAMELRKDMRYDEALQLIDRALFLEPLNFAAQAMRTMTIDARQLSTAGRLHDLRQTKLMEQRLYNLEGMIPYDEILTYPEEWPEITRIRLLGLQGEKQESEQTRQARLKLQETIQIKVDNARLDNVIEYLRTLTGLNITVNWNALQAVGVAQDTPISLNLSSVRAEQALRLVLQQAGAGSFEPVGFSINDGIVEISTVADLKRTVETRVYDIRDLLVQVPNFDDAPPFDLNQALSNTSSGGSTEGSRGGGQGGGGGGAQTGGGIFGGADSSTPAEAGPTREEIVDQIRTLVTTTIGDTTEWIEQQSTLQELNGNLIVKTTPDNHREVLSLLAQLRETRAIQISVEARFLLVDEAFLEDIGVDLDINITDPGGNFGPITIAQDSATLAAPGENDFGEPGAFPGGSFVPGLGFTPALRALDFGASFIDDVQVNLLIRATQANRRSISLTAPRVTFFNGQRAYVLIARQVAFVSDLEPVPDSGGFDVTISVTNSGVVLDVEGVISADRRYVTLTLRPSLGNVIRPIRQVQVNSLVDAIQQGDLDGDGVIDPIPDTDVPQILITGFVEVPELEITTVRCTVSVPDKGTLLIGGQRIVGETESEAGVPVLSKIPVLNRLFNNRSIVKEERTLLILVKPTIIIQSELEEQNFPGLLDDPLNYNVGERF